jgi:phosphomannomutase
MGFYPGNLIGKSPELVHRNLMNAHEQNDNLAVLTAEEILRTIYGDDFKGCTVSLDAIAAMVDHALKQQEAQSRELRELYEKVVEATHLLSTPPDATKVTEQVQLNTLLSERLDAIRAITTKTLETTARVKAQH